MSDLIHTSTKRHRQSRGRTGSSKEGYQHSHRVWGWDGKKLHRVLRSQVDSGEYLAVRREDARKINAGVPIKSTVKDDPRIRFEFGSVEETPKRKKGKK